MKIISIIGENSYSTCGITDHANYINKKFLELGHDVKIKTLNFTNKGKALIATEIEQSDLGIIHFAPYMYSKWGIFPTSSIQYFRQILFSNKTIMYFHEIWIGDYENAPLKEKIIGVIQKKTILKILADLDSKRIFTTNSASLYRLEKYKINANLINLCGSIPFNKTPKKYFANSKNIKLVFFGSIYPSFPFDIFFEKIKSISLIIMQNITFVLVGNNRELKAYNYIKKKSSELNFDLESPGRAKTSEISSIFQSCDIGVSTTPLDAIGKSSSTSAMLEHRLPIITFDDFDTPNPTMCINQEFSKQIFCLNHPDFGESLIMHLKKAKKPFYDGVQETVTQLLGS